MTSIVKLSIQCDHDNTGKRSPGSEIAYMYFDKGGVAETDEWQDPFGGSFTDDEETMFQRVAVGAAQSLIVSAGTKWEATLRCRLVATFM